MIPYILHVTVITTICFLFYKLLLQKETFYHLNRWVLIGCMAVSFGLPLLPVPHELSWRDKWTELRNPNTTDEGASMVNAKTSDEGTPMVNANTTDAGAPTVNASSIEVPTVAPVETVPVDTTATAKVGHKPGHSRRGHSLNTASSTEPAGVGWTQAGDGGTQSGVARTQAGDGAKQAKVGGMEAGDGAKQAKVGGMEAGDGAKQAGVGAARGQKPGVSDASKGEESTTATLFLVLTWLFYGYLFGLLVFGGSFLVQIAVLLYQSYSRPVIRDGRFRIVEVRGNRAPCSFGNTIFINPENYDWETYNQILIHEKIHVSGRHTLDILLAEIAVVFQWFNPFVWWYRREVENNLEFLTDASVLLHRHVERSAYQLSLLRVSAPHLPFSITNNYNQSLLKRRIVMMNSKRSSLHTVWKYFFLLPVLSVMVCALNKPAAFAATSLSPVSDHPAAPGNAAGPASTASPFKLPALLASALSAFGDTTIRPATGNASVNERSRTDDSSREHHYYNEDDYEMLKAYSAGQNAYDLDRLNLKLDIVPQIKLQMHLSDQQLQLIDQQTNVIDQQMKLTEQQLMAANLNLNGRDQMLMNLDIKPVMDLKLNIQPNVDPKIGLSHLEIMSDTGLREGAWFATSSDDKLDIELKSGNDEHNWNSSFSVDKKEINPFPGQGNVEFKLVREAGTIAFKGQFDGQEGFGHFKFTPDEGYMSAIKQMGVEEVDDRRQFAYFTLNIRKEYVDMIVHSGYPHISQRDLISFAAMKIDKGFIDNWRASGFEDADNPRTLISLKAMKIDRAYADEMKAAGYDHLSVHDLISLRAMNVDGAYIRSMGRNSDNTPIPVREVISYKAMHIDSGYVEGLRKAGYTNLSRNDVTTLYSMHVTPDYIKGLQDAGYTNLPPRELTSLKAMGITPEFIKGYREMGFKDLDVRELTSLKAMNITPEFVKGFRDLGYTDLSPREFSSLKAMNVTPDFVREFNKLGFNKIPVHTLTSLKATGVDADYVAKMKARGFVSDDLNKYIRLKNDFN